MFIVFVCEYTSNSKLQGIGMEQRISINIGLLNKSAKLAENFSLSYSYNTILFFINNSAYSIWIHETMQLTPKCRQRFDFFSKLLQNSLVLLWQFLGQSGVDKLV